MTREEMIRLAHVAHRPDIAARINAASEVTSTPVGHGQIDLNVALRPDRREVEINRWTIDGAVVYVVERSLVDWGGGDASVYVDVLVTEHDLTDPGTAGLVVTVVDRLPGSGEAAAALAAAFPGAPLPRWGGMEL